MKKLLPFLWLLPILCLLCLAAGFLVNENDPGDSDFIAMLVAAICWTIQMFVPVVYYYKKETLPVGILTFIITIAVLLGFVIIEYFDTDMLVFVPIPAVCAAICTFMLWRADRQGMKAKSAHKAADTAAKPAVQEKLAAKEGTKVPLEEIKQLKELLDMGAITQEEFDAKKKQLLGL